MNCKTTATRMRSTVQLGVVLSVMLTVSVAMAQDRPGPMAFLKDKTATIEKIIKHKVSTAEAIKARGEEMRGVISALVDYDDLARRSLGKHWDARTPEEQTEYRALFRELVELTYVDRLGKRSPDQKYTVEWESEDLSDDVGSSICFVLYEDTETELEFKLKPSDSGWRIHDLAIDGASIEDSYRRKYSETIDKEGYEGLTKKMRKRIDELKAK